MLDLEVEEFSDSTRKFAAALLPALLAAFLPAPPALLRRSRPFAGVLLEGAPSSCAEVELLGPQDAFEGAAEGDQYGRSVALATRWAASGDTVLAVAAPFTAAALLVYDSEIDEASGVHTEHLALISPGSLSRWPEHP